MKTITSVAVTAALAAAALPPAQAQDGCRNVRFAFVNRHESGRPIRVDEIIYFNTVNNRDQTEQVRNLECAPRATCGTRGDTLRDSENVALRNIRFIYRVRDADGRGWGRRTPSQGHDPDDRRCRADRIYGPFVITR